MDNPDLTALSDAEFDDELTRRIDRVQAAWDALQTTLGPHLEGAARPLERIPANADPLWEEMEASEASLEDGWRELARRKERRLGR